ncbi:MAG TPA: hypothetical protein PKC58_17605, partial [Ignavibacteria bacterium]|nr:hypothetical protein [Ignavibacteria bacterium]
YQFASNSPIVAIDLDGLESVEFMWKFYFERAFGYNYQQLQTDEDVSIQFTKELLIENPKNGAIEFANTLDPSQAQSPLDLFFRLTIGAFLSEVLTLPEVLVIAPRVAPAVVNATTRTGFWSFRWANPKNWFRSTPKAKKLDDFAGQVLEDAEAELIKGGANKIDDTETGASLLGDATKEGSEAATKGVSNIAKNAKKMSPDDIGDFLKAGKDWHKGSAKKDFLKQFKKELKGDTNADFYFDKTTKDVFLKSNKSGNWIKTGLKYE